MRLTKKEFEEYWDKAYQTPYTLVDLPSGAKMVSNVRDVFIMFNAERGEMQAITRDREWFGCTFGVRDYPKVKDTPKEWSLIPSEYCSI